MKLSHLYLGAALMMCACAGSARAQYFSQSPLDPPEPDTVLLSRDFGNGGYLQPCSAATSLDNPRTDAARPLVFVAENIGNVDEVIGSSADNSIGCDGGCGDECCDACCDCCCPCWIVTADAILLWRDGGDPGDLSYVNSGGPGPVTMTIPGLNDADMGVAGRVSLIRRLDECRALEVAFLGVDSLNSSTTITGSNILQFPGYTFPVPGDITFGWSTEVYSTELNLRRQWNDRTTLLAGFRMVEVQEDFLASSVNGGPSTLQYRIDTGSYFYGGQIGAQVDLYRGNRWWLQTWGKAGVYGVTAKSTVDDTVSVARSTNTGVGFVGDLSITAVRQITDCLAFRVGYYALWIDGYAAAPDQIYAADLSVPSTPFADVTHSNNLFLNGVLLGLEGVW